MQSRTRGPVVEQEDILRQQVAVAVPHHPGRHAVVEQGPAALQVPPGQALGGERGLVVQHGANEGSHLLEVVLPVLPHGIH
jgi:hypothetical protein